MEYWIVYKAENGKRKYLCDIDKNGKRIHTENEDDALKFYNFQNAMCYFNERYCVMKRFA